MTDPRALIRAAVITGTIFAIACDGRSKPMNQGDGAGEEGGNTGEPNDTPPGNDDETPDVPGGQTPAQFTVKLVPEGTAGMQRVSFAIPLARGSLADPGTVKIAAGTTELSAARRGLARYGDGSLRSVQIQVDVDVSLHSELGVALVGATAGELPAVPVASTLTGTGNNVRPKVWALLPVDVLVASGVAGHLAPQAAVANTPLDTWSKLCDYDEWDTDAFVAGSASRDVWLYDRVTAMIRGHVITGELSPLRSAYREAAIYLTGMTINNGVATGIAVPTASDDLKYFYSQGIALHYLLTGDDRYREAAEAVSARVATMWNPRYEPDRFWTERHAGFALLAHEWAARVTDDRQAEIVARADTAARAFLELQASQHSAGGARCFAHSATDHGEDYGTEGCSPWMSAILAEALDDHAERVGGQRATDVAKSLTELGRIIARDGRDGDGRPYYWMGVGTSSELDPYEEHWGESAYVVALAWDAGGRSETTLRSAADELVEGFRSLGEVGHTRSFNWQCRGAVMTPALLR